ncbi:glycosyl hydrolase [Synoicihabitans lomoniglobus]|uniref:Glycosyl hydrolase n=1 Tax=Synoicihabitans lomoniglobus TaxID=2909285 RepID=A0AAF0I579_9BACT|nr:glycosyl hydrolase [Opitutaceae bacterium LMO-M01]WED67228.1 glycosyl hydrolase [Opitutaceae bacterium LMO-M01]
MRIDESLTLADLAPALSRFWQLSGDKIDLMLREYDLAQGSPVFTQAGKYSTRGWTEWTEGFYYGSAFLQFDATGEQRFADEARKLTVERMASHVSHIGVHDHGFNNLSTYGNWLRLQREGKLPADQIDFCELAVKISGAVQASRWSPTHDGGGYIYSFNGPHSLFVDTIRSCRIVMVAHAMGHSLMGENDESNSLLERALQHIEATARYSVFYGEGRDSYDEWGRTAHESVFNPNDGRFRCPNSQQGYSGFTTWTRGLAWAMVGFPEQLEFLDTLSDAELEPFGGKAKWRELMLKGARATCDWFIANTPTDGIPYWDGGAPGLVNLGDWRERESEPFNAHEPIDSSAAAIGAQGLIRLGRYLGADTADGRRYIQAGLTSFRTLLTDTYLGIAPDHQGLLLHSIYHRPNNWDYTPEGQSIPCGEACMWGDYHLRELALYVDRLRQDQPEYTFFGCLKS